MAGGRGLRATLRVAKPSQPKAARESLPRYQNEAPGVVRTSGALSFGLTEGTVRVSEKI